MLRASALLRRRHGSPDLGKQREVARSDKGQQKHLIDRAEGLKEGEGLIPGLRLLLWRRRTKSTAPTPFINRTSVFVYAEGMKDNPARLRLAPRPERKVVTMGLEEFGAWEFAGPDYDFR